MKKKLIIAGSVAGGILVLAMIWGLIVYPLFIARSKEYEPSILEVIKEREEISLDEDSGIIYMNRELIVFFEPGTSSEIVKNTAAEVSALVDDSMADIDIYRFTFDKSRSASEMKKMIKKLKENEFIEEVKMNTVCDPGSDDLPEETGFEYKDPAYPNDLWDGSKWNMEHPEGGNWGMEAIKAPAAWAYLDDLSDVRVGLIDSMPDKSNEDLNSVIAKTDCLFFESFESPNNIRINTVSVFPEDHGTHVSGIMNGGWNNGKGVSGILGDKGTTYYCETFVMSEDGMISMDYGTAYSYMEAIKHLTDQDVQAINISQNTSRLIGFAASRGNKNAINHLKEQADLAGKIFDRIVQSRKAQNRPDFVVCVAAGNANYTKYYPSNKSIYGYSESPDYGSSVSKAFGGDGGDWGNVLACYNNFLNLIEEESAKDRIIVVGSVGIDGGRTNSEQTFYEYSYFSNVGERVDICAPGEDIYSTVVNGYGYMSGTSMATPHVTGAAGMMFAANPALSGPDVKDILCSTAAGRYYYYEGYSGLLNLEDALIAALKTNKQSVNSVIKRAGSNAVDLCFVVDTTGSMSDDIQETKDNMLDILDSLGEKTDDYRIALIDYRDFSSRTGYSVDYPAKLQMDFSSDKEEIINGINSLSLGNGGDNAETVYSGLTMAVGLNWKKEAKKAIIVLGDAEPLDPEPETGYTYDWVIQMLYSADIGVDFDASDERVLGNPEDSKINVFAIGSESSDYAMRFFENMTSATGGEYAEVDDAAEVSEAMIEMIEKIEVKPSRNVKADFTDDCAGAIIDIYAEDKYQFSIKADENGTFKLDDMEIGKYSWKCEKLRMDGTLKVKEKGRSASVQVEKRPWTVSVIRFWEKNHIALICVGSAIVLAGAAAAIIIGIWKKKKSKASVSN